MMTLANMREGMADKVAAQVIDIFIRQSEVLELLQFDDTISPGGVGSTMIYGYVQKKNPSTTTFRALNAEYTADNSTTQKKTVELKIFGGSFQIDRVIKQAEGLYDNMAEQIKDKVTSAVGTFHNAMINGDIAVNANGFDGLDKMLVGTSTEYNTDKVIDLSTTAKLTENADEFYEALLKMLNDTEADAIFVNSDMKTKIQTVARKLGYKTESEEAFGRVVTKLGEGGVRIIDLKNTYDAAGDPTPIINKVTRTVAEVPTTGLTDIFAVRFDIANGFHAATVSGDQAISQYTPDFTQPGAVKTGEVEMVAAVVLKNTRVAGVLRNIKLI